MFGNELSWGLGTAWGRPEDGLGAATRTSGLCWFPALVTQRCFYCSLLITVSALTSRGCLRGADCPHLCLLLKLVWGDPKSREESRVSTEEVGRGLTKGHGLLGRVGGFGQISQVATPRVRGFDSGNKWQILTGLVFRRRPESFPECWLEFQCWGTDCRGSF